MDVLDLAALRAAAVAPSPFDHLLVPAFLPQAACAAANADYPAIDQPGSFPVEGLSYGPGLAAVLAALQGPGFRQAIEQKFALNLAGRPTMVTVRGQCGPRDGGIHTDSVTKLITVLLYLCPSWEAPGGRLRLLRSPHDIEDVVVEVPPIEGTLLVFKRTDNSWHGHLPHIGPRRVIQLNWVTSGWVKLRETARHRISAWGKRTLALLGGRRRAS